MRSLKTCDKLIDAAPELDSEFAKAVIGGLSKSRKTLPCRYFYDEQGSRLFEEITRLPEYYPTRAETAILASHAAEMMQGLPNDGVLIEFGSGSSVKTQKLLDHAAAGISYVPIDISASALAEAKTRLQKRYPGRDIQPIEADFSLPVKLPDDLAARPRIGFFPGSTIGNLKPADAVTLLQTFRKLLSPGGRLLIGVDLKKDSRKLVLAYNDAAGVTAAFNLNLLRRINSELGGQFDLTAFHHQAIYNPREGRIEMRLISSRDQDVFVGGHRFTFRPGEFIHTENSYKYTLEQFQDVAREAGWHPSRVWTDAAQLFSVHELLLT